MNSTYKILIAKSFSMWKKKRKIWKEKNYQFYVECRSRYTTYMNTKISSGDCIISKICNKVNEISKWTPDYQNGIFKSNYNVIQIHIVHQETRSLSDLFLHGHLVSSLFFLCKCMTVGKDILVVGIIKQYFKGTTWCLSQPL